MNTRVHTPFWDIVGGVAFGVAVVLTFILFLFATPDQMSAECDVAFTQLNGGV